MQARRTGQRTPVIAGQTGYWSAAVGIAATLAYLWLAPPVGGDGDSCEFVLVLARNGVPHPTGYPLYVLLGHWFVVALHALGTNWNYAANAWSAMGGGVAMGLMHALAARLVPAEARLSMRARSLIALLPVSLFVFNPVWTSATTLAEVYSWQLAWVMGTALAFVGFMRCLRSTGDAASPAPSKDRGLTLRAAGWGFLCGLGFSHHSTSILVAGPLGIALLIALARARRLGLPVVVPAVIAAAVPLSSYLTILAKANHPGPEVWGLLEPTWSGLWKHVTATQYRDFFGRFAPIASQQRFLNLYVFPYLFTMLALMLVLAMRARDAAERWISRALFATVATHTAISFTYGVSDPSSYFLAPLGIAMTVLVPLGVSAAETGARPRRVVGLAALAIAIAAVAQAGRDLRIAVGRRDILVTLDRDVHGLWTTIPMDRGVVLWGGYRHIGYQVFNGERRGLHVINPAVLAAPIPRDRFIATYGFDSYGASALRPGFAPAPKSRGPEYDAFVVRLAAQIHEATSQPAVFLSPTNELRLVGAPGAGRGSLQAVASRP